MDLSQRGENMRWITCIGTVALMLVSMIGCQKQCFQPECDYEHSRAKLVADLAVDPDAASKPTSVAYSAPPATVLDPGRKIRYISLAECIAIALEQGTTGNRGAIQVPSGATFGQGASFSQDSAIALTQTDSIRAFVYDSATLGARMELAASQYDAIYLASMNWTTTDTPIGTALQAFQAGAGGINAIENESASFISQIVKPLPTGGVAGITFQTDYQFSNLPARVNPAYTPRLVFGFEQPLLRQFGTEINQISQNHPGSILFPNAPINRGLGGDPGEIGTGDRAEIAGGMIVTRIRFDQARAEFEEAVSFMMANVELAYWSLYSSYWTLYSREQALRQAYEAFNISKARFAAGRIGVDELAQTRGQYELFRGNRLSALGQVLENERQLRKLLGLKVEDCTRLVPSDKPTIAPYKPDWKHALNEAIAFRPELRQARDNIRVAQLDVKATRNQLLPDLRFNATYDINAIGNRLDGPTVNNAFRNLTRNEFNNISGGLSLNVPIGRRDVYARLRIARLNLARKYAALQDMELKTQQYLALRYRRLIETYEQIKIQRAQREAFAVQLKARFEEFNNGKGTVDILLEAQRFWADALASKYANIGADNAELAAWEWAKGTLLRHNNIILAEGQLPHCALERATEHHRKRARAMVIKERENAVPHQVCEGGECSLVTPALPKHEAASLPALLADSPKPVDGKGVLATPYNPNESPVPLVLPKKTLPTSLPAPREVK